MLYFGFLLPLDFIQSLSYVHGVNLVLSLIKCSCILLLCHHLLFQFNWYVLFIL